uniref:Coiled-coil domain containing 124 n=1 Tax=Myotis lucifugus TaxID=59463 RepID=G1PAA5_MYOLU
MPKKFQGENTKSAAARARRAEAKAAADARKHKELEDAYWKDEDKHVMREFIKTQEEKEKRRLEQLERKKEAQRLLEEEDSKLKSSKAPRVAVPSKVTRAQIEETLRRDHQHKEAQEPAEKVKSHLEVPLEENVNRRVLEEGSLEARTIEDEVLVPSLPGVVGGRPGSQPPESAAMRGFENQLPRLKQREPPTLRLSQLKQLLKKEWLRSPDNPNQRAVPFNTPK